MSKTAEKVRSTSPRAAKVVFSPERAAIVLAKPNLDEEEAAWYLNVSLRWLQHEGRPKHKVPYYRPPDSNQILFRRADLDRVLEAWQRSDRIGSPPRVRDEGGRFKKSTTKAKRGDASLE